MWKLRLGNNVLVTGQDLKLRSGGLVSFNFRVTRDSITDIDFALTRSPLNPYRSGMVWVVVSFPKYDQTEFSECGMLPW